MIVWKRIASAATAAFFRNFFVLLVLAASAAQWSVLAWVIGVGGGVTLPLWAHVAAIAALYAVNRILTRPSLRRRGGVFRVYTATALIALFCAAFLLISTLVFQLVHGVAGAVSAQALSAAGQAMVGEGLNGAFRWVASAGMASIAAAMLYGYTFGQRQVRTTHVSIPLKGLPPGRVLRVAQISDVHVGQNLTMAQLRAFVARVNAAQPDLICITGDIADSPLADYATFFPVLGQLRARFGVCAILGNHDHYAGADGVVAALQRWTEFRVLRDSAVNIDVDGATLHVIGLDDRGRDWARGLQSDGQLAALLAAAPADAALLLLCHRPDIFHHAASVSVPLTLSGHTHGGQLAVPWRGGRRRNLAEFITRFDRGLYRSRDSYLYVNCGLGVTGQRIRLFTPREVTVLELRTAA